MGSNTISVSDEAYSILKSLQEENESFSSVIIKLAKRQDLLKYAGVLSEERGHELSQTIHGSRNISSRRYAR